MLNGYMGGTAAMGANARGPGSAGVEPGVLTRQATRWERLPFGLVLLAVWTVALVGVALLATGGLSGLNGAIGRVSPPSAVPSYQELAPGERNTALGRDLVIAPGDATAARIEDLVASLAAETPNGLLRLN